MQTYVIGPLKVNLQKLEKLGEEKALEQELQRALTSKLSLSQLKELSYTILKRSLDMRKKMQASFIYKLALPNLSTLIKPVLLQDLLDKKIIHCEESNYVWTQVANKLASLREQSKAFLAKTEARRPVVVGFGPAGIYAALILAQAGLRPIVIERGQPVEKRVADFARLQKEGIFDPDSNAQFGEGGAGCFSDGKLGTRIKDDLLSLVLDILVSFGADASILWRQNPHIGTDKLRPLIKCIREEIIALGGEVRFNTKLIDFELNPELKSIIIENADKTVEKMACTTLVLAPGHSARELYYLLAEKGQALSAKPFAVGFRIEQKQAAVNLVQYGKTYKDFLVKMLGPAEYHLACKVKVDETERRVYTFCMCPGGEVIASASEQEALCVNGMSYQDRQAENANAAVICAVNPKELGEDLFAGLEFQARIERAAYQLTGSYKAPYMLVSDYVKGVLSEYEFADLLSETNFSEAMLGVLKDQELSMLCQSEVHPSYKPAAVKADLTHLYPPFISKALAKGILQLNKQMVCFASSKSNLLAPETRTSAPLRIERSTDSLMAVKAPGIYPCGEGAGYAGGISSAAVDGLKIAMQLIKDCLGLDSAIFDLT